MSVDWSHFYEGFDGEPANDAPTSKQAPTAEESPKQQVPTTPWQERLVSAPSAWYTEAPPKRQYLLRDTRHPKARGVVPLGKSGQLIAPGGVGKTLLEFQLAVSVATGAPFLGVFSVPTPGRVLLVLGEEDKDECQRRLHHAVRVSGCVSTPAEDSIVMLPLHGVSAPMLELDACGNTVATPFLHWLQQYIIDQDFRLVVLDPLSRFAGPKAETDNAAGTRFVEACESLVSPTRFVMNAHHVNKTARSKNSRVDASSGRGSSSLVDGARWQCALNVEELKLEGEEEQDRLGEIVTFEVTKSNYCAKPPPVLLRRHADHGGALVPLDRDDVEAVERARDKIASKAEREDAKERSVRQRDHDDDRAVRDLMVQHPDAGVTALVAHLRAARACGQSRAYAAVVRVKGRK